MPPKRAAMVQELRDSYTEEYSLTEVREWFTTVIKAIDDLSEKAYKLQGEVEKLDAPSAYSAEALQKPGSAATAPIVPLLKEFQALGRAVFNSAERIRLVILIRVPEYKEEDNLGVAVQQAVLRCLDGLQNKLLKGVNAAGEKEAASAPSAASMFLLRDYLSTRAKLEDAILNADAGGDDKSSSSNNEEEKKKPKKIVAPSSYAELQQLDVDILYKLELASRQLSTVVKAFINTYAVNWKKLIDPRNAANDRMVA